MDLYLKVRHAHFGGGLSGRQIARDFGISRDSVAKMLAYSEPPGYRRTAPIKRPKLDPYVDQIDSWGPVLTRFPGAYPHIDSININALRLPRLCQLRVNTGPQLSI